MSYIRRQSVKAWRWDRHTDAPDWVLSAIYDGLITFRQRREHDLTSVLEVRDWRGNHLTDAESPCYLVHFADGTLQLFSVEEFNREFAPASEPAR